MTAIKDLVRKVRSKNAGPFWLTIDIFCGTSEAFQTVSKALETAAVATLFRVDPDRIRRFDIAALNVVKVSFPRPVVQGTPADRDMHGASYAVLLGELEIDAAR